MEKELKIGNSSTLPRFTIVEFYGCTWVLENYNKRHPQLIRENEKGERVGLEISKYEDLLVIKYPAQLAFEYLENHKNPVLNENA